MIIGRKPPTTPTPPPRNYLSPICVMIIHSSFNSVEMKLRETFSTKNIMRIKYDMYVNIGYKISIVNLMP
jgi:hypothetical protein